MQLRLEHAGYQELVSPTTPIETTFPLSLGSVFQLHPGDEERQPRVVEEGGDIFIGAYLHGVPQELPAGQISCGFVFRCVHQTRDVDSMTRRVIPTQAEVGPARQEKLRVFKKARRERMGCTGPSVCGSSVGEGEEGSCQLVMVEGATILWLSRHPWMLLAVYC